MFITFMALETNLLFLSIVLQKVEAIKDRLDDPDVLYGKNKLIH
jgi:hypothetical protein